MTFLNPLVLFGLAAAAIPVLLHLFNLRKLEKVEFSTLRFLRELEKTKIRRLKLRQLLLLFLRTMLIILIVCAFARPTLQSTSIGGAAARAKTTAVILVDNSYTMTSSGQEGEYLKMAKGDAGKVLDLAKEGDDVFLVPLSESGATAPASAISPQRDVVAIRSEINAMNPSYVHKTVEEALRYSAKLLSTTKNLNKEVYVISDFKTGSLRTEKKEPQAEDIFPSGTRFFLLPVGHNTRQNLGIESVKIENSLLGVGKPLTLEVTVANWGAHDVKNEVVSVFLNGTRVSQQALDVESQRSAQCSFSITPTSAGYLHGVVELQDDDLDFDNRRSFVVDVPKDLRILLVGNPFDLRYITMALMVQPVQGQSTMSLKTVGADRLSTNDIDAADVIVFANVRDLSSGQREQIRRFVEGGGGVVYFPGSKTDSASFFSTWGEGLGLPPVGAIVRPQLRPAQQTTALESDKVDFRHPIFQGMFEQDLLRRGSAHLRQQTGAPSLESPAIQTYARYQTNPRSVPIITLSDGFPFLFEQKLQKGIALVFCVSPTAEWSDFPLKGLFVPLLYRSVAYAAQQQSVPATVTAGEDVVLTIRNRGGSNVVVQNPEKVDIVNQVSNRGRESTVHFTETTTPGIYSVRSNDEVLKEFAVTIDPAESNTTPADQTAIEAMFKQLGVPPNAVWSLTQRDRVQQTVLQSRVGVELWKYFVAAALLIGLIELVVARTTRSELSSQRFSGSQPDLKGNS
jgi:hypothetical protein